MHDGSADETKVMTSLNSVLPKVATASAAFGELSADQQADIWSRARIRRLLRGETLVWQNTPADAVFVVVSGRFEVRLEGMPMPLAEIGVGQPIGEIAFFAGGLRTATVVAVRDSVVLELDRASFEDVARRVPAIYDQLLGAMARRLAETTARITASRRRVRSRSSRRGMAAFHPRSLIVCAALLQVRDDVFFSATPTSKRGFRICGWTTRPFSIG